MSNVYALEPPTKGKVIAPLRVHEFLCIFVAIASISTELLDFLFLTIKQHRAKALHMEGGQGTCGRIACWREDFHKIGGYDEDCHPVDGPDVDLLERLRLLHKGRGVRREVMGTHGTFAIPNKKKQLLSGVKSLNRTWQEMETRNCLEFQKRRGSFGCVRNSGRVPALSIKEVLSE